MPNCSVRSFPSLLLCASLATGPGGLAYAGEPAGTTVAHPAPGVEVQYEPLAPDADTPGPARLDVSVQAPAGRLVSRFRLDPAAAQPMERLETRLELPSAGPLRSVVLGDTQASGGSWSHPVRIGGLRFGRALTIRTPADAAAPAASMAAGASDYEVELGRLRLGPDRAEDSYGAGYAAAAWRTGLGAGLSAEARGEWTPQRTAQGLELQQRVGAAGTLQAVLARSQTADEDGLRWGLQLLHGQGPGAWRIDVQRAARDFTPVTGAPEARTALAAATQLPLGRRTLADLSYARAFGLEPGSAEATLKLATQTLLAPQTALGLGLSLHDRPQARWDPAVSLSLSLPLTPVGR